MSDMGWTQYNDAQERQAEAEKEVVDWFCEGMSIPFIVDKVIASLEDWQNNPIERAQTQKGVEDILRNELNYQIEQAGG